MKQIGQLNEEDLKAYQAGDKSVVMKYMSEASDLSHYADILVDELQIGIINFIQDMHFFNSKEYDTEVFTEKSQKLRCISLAFKKLNFNNMIKDINHSIDQGEI